LPIKGLPVYEDKHSDKQKKFSPDKIIFIAMDHLVLFYEIRKNWTPDEWKELMDYFCSLEEDFPQ